MRKLWSIIMVTLSLSMYGKLNEVTLMHEVRQTPYPLNEQIVEVSSPALLWPDKFPHLGPVLDGVDKGEHYKPEVTYKVRLASDKKFTKDVMQAERNWAFFNPFKALKPGRWYWQHAYVTPEGVEEWSEVYSFTVTRDARQNVRPTFETVVEKLPTYHPRVLLDAKDWEQIIDKNKGNAEAKLFIDKANKTLRKELHHIDTEIDTSKVGEQPNEVMRKSLLIRESRKIVDREEANIEAMTRAYLLTKDEKYYRGAMDRLQEVLSWKGSPNFAGDFNVGTLLQISTSAYDAFYNLMTPEEKAMVLESIRSNGSIFFHEFVNHLENRIADNHVWQMTLRFLTNAAFATYGDLPEASLWADYCYNMWVARMPGLFKDGGWHNGDSYFHVNIRTLIEVPVLYSRITGYDFFNDPWYNKNANYVIYQQLPFSKSAGHGNSHEGKLTPNGTRIGYADALARECQNSAMSDYFEQCMQDGGEQVRKSFMGKSGDLTWYRCTTLKERVQPTIGLADLKNAHIFAETGLGTMHTQMENPTKNASLSFRSSPYGSTSHALANQNAFNTFYGGEAIFYSSGHRTGFTDDHSMYAYRNTRAHNAILVNGMTQIIGTEGYGWIPQHYAGDEISYFVGDASNAYGEVTAELWHIRGELSGTEYTPEKGWDKDRLEKFRRHVVQLGETGLFVIYDELEATEAVSFNYLLHTVHNPMKVAKYLDDNHIVVKSENKLGEGTAHLFSSEPMDYTTSNEFFVEAVNWKNKTDKNGKLIPMKKHWHFDAKTTNKAEKVRFLTIIDTHDKTASARKIVRDGDLFVVDGWTIKCNLTSGKEASFSVSNKEKGAAITYNARNGKAKITDNVAGKKVKQKLTDYLPTFGI